MNHRFLRDEAARFRAMADDTDHEATKLRRLATAADYEERAKAADDGAGPDAAELDVAEMDGEVAVQTEPSVGKATRVKLDMKNGRALKETVLVERRPIVRRG